MKIFLLLVTFFLVGQLFAQDSTVVQFHLIDKKSGDPIPNVSGTISINSEKKHILTSRQLGLITINCSEKDKVNARFSHAFYDSQNLDIAVHRSINEDTININVYLVTGKIQYVSEVNVKPIGTPYVVYKSERLSVDDFEIKKDGKIILLTYTKRLNKGSELLLYDGSKVQNSFQVPGVALELVRDYRGNPNIVCEENIFGIYLEDEQLKIARLEKDYFIKYVMPIVDTQKTKMYFSNFNPLYPAFDYYMYDQQDSSYNVMASVKDELMMELYRSEYKWVDVRTKIWAKYKELETGIDAEIWVGANYFTQSVYYEELYAPLFQRNDSLFLFDYYKDQLITFDFLGNRLDSVSIYHHYRRKSSGWKKELIQDQITGQIYAHFEKDGISYLGLIDVKTGEIKERVQLEFKYVDKIEVFDNYVYYIYRPYESAQKKFLYKEQLPYNFPAMND